MGKDMGRKKGKKGSGKKGIRKDLAGLYQNTKAGIQAVTGLDAASDAESTVALADAARKAVRTYNTVKYLELKTGAKAGVLLGRGYAKAARKIRNAKRDMALMDMAAGMQPPRQFRVSRGPNARLSGQPRKALKSHMASGAAPALRNAAAYDVSSLEAKNGIRPEDRRRADIRGRTEGLEAKNRVRSKAEQQRGKLAPKERESLQGKEKADQLAEKNHVKSRDRKDNLKKKRKKARKKKGVAAGAAKRELKYLAARQIFMEGETSGVSEALVGIGKSVLVDWAQRLGKGGAKLAGKLLIKLSGALAALLFHVLLMLMLFLLPLLVPIIIAFGAIVMVGGIAAMVVGIFISVEDTEQGDFAVKLINDHKAAIIEEAEGYAGKWHDQKEVEEVNISYSGIARIDANSDDMLLVYMSIAADSRKLADGEGHAPLLHVDTNTKKKAMDVVLDEMFYIESVSYEEKTRQVVVTVTPAPTPAAAPPPEPGHDGQGAEGDKPEEPETRTIIQTYYVANVVIAGITADAWREANSVDEQVYFFLRDMFLSFGYVPGGGNAVCVKYMEAELD